jgi:phytoene synthase
LTTPALSWEHRLFALAYEPLRHHSGDQHISLAIDPEQLRAAYTYCAVVTQEHSKTFYTASSLLPPAKRRAVRALYAFCRVTDNLVDSTDGDVMSRLEAWRERALLAPPAVDDLVTLAWADTVTRYRIPRLYAHQLIDGVARDIAVKRYRTFDELAEYSYGVASTVGLMAMHIVGYSGPEAIPYAVKLGVALQLTNILRDVWEDWTMGRLYLPQDELTEFGLSEADIADRRLTNRWKSFIQFQIERNCRIYAEAMPGIALLHRDGRFAIAAAAELYRAILGNIRAYGGDVFTRRAYIPRWEKLIRLPGIWFRAIRP